MNTALILKSNGKIYVCRLPEEPKKWDYESGGDPPEISPYVMPDYYYHLEEYNAAKQKAIKEAVLCADQKQARKLICDNHTYFENKDTPYIIPGLDFKINEEQIPCPDEVVGCAVYHCRRAAILILPKQEENEQDELWKELIDIYDTTDKSSYGYAALINKLKQHYTISKKK